MTQHNLLDTYKKMKDEIDIIYDEVPLFILYFLQGEGQLGFEELNAHIKLPQESLRGYLARIERCGFIEMEDKEIAVTEFGLRFLQDLGFVEGEDYHEVT